MAATTGTKIVKDGLVLNIDAANVAKNAGLDSVEYLIVAGGGGGGAGSGGNAGGSGGGAGGLRAGIINLTPQAYTITVGAGGTGVYNGTGGTNTSAIGGVGGNSSALGLVAAGGGGGASFNTTNKVAGMNGGSGAGGHPRTTPYLTGYGFGNTPTTDPPQGNNGSIVVSGSASFGGGGGGGGAGSPGEDMQAFGANGNHPGINAGHGIVSSITGSSIFYAGGGGGGAASGTGNEGLGGLGGGANGGRHTPIIRAQDANPNTGGGGGGGNARGNPNNGGGNGGSGIVIIRYPGPQRAVGGTVTQVGTDTIHTYTTVGNSTFEPLTYANNTAFAAVPDLSNNGNIGTAANGPVYNSDNNGSFVFDGVNDEISIPTYQLSISNSSSPYTLSAWINRTGNTVGGGIITQYSSGSSSNRFGLRENNSKLSWWKGVNLAVSTNNIPINTWKHIAGVKRSDNSVSIYLDGNEVGVGTDNFDFENAILKIGRFGTIAPFSGKISQVSVYDRALTAQEIAENFEATRGRYGI